MDGGRCGDQGAIGCGDGAEVGFDIGGGVQLPGSGACRRGHGAALCLGAAVGVALLCCCAAEADIAAWVGALSDFEGCVLGVGEELAGIGFCDCRLEDENGDGEDGKECR